MTESLEGMMKNVNTSFESRTKKMELAKMAIWAGYGAEENALTDLVGSRFRELLNEVGPVIAKWVSNPGEDMATVMDYTVTYRPKSSDFHIKIDRIKTPHGIMDAETLRKADEYGINGCPHVYLEPITFRGDDDPRVAKFMKDNHVSYIHEMDSDCEHK